MRNNKKAKFQSINHNRAETAASLNLLMIISPLDMLMHLSSPFVIFATKIVRRPFGLDRAKENARIFSIQAENFYTGSTLQGLPDRIIELGRFISDKRNLCATLRQKKPEALK
jgi:hypothetical protein